MRGSRRRSIYRREYEKPTDANILRLLMPSILGMLLCMVCLAGMTWAWFTDTSDVATATIQAAHFDVEVTFDNEEGVSQEGNVYTLAENKEYKVTLTATGNTTKSGYCKVIVDRVSYCTSLPPEGKSTGEGLTFKVCSSEGKLEVNSGWKKFDGCEKISEKEIIGNGTVQSQDLNEKATEHTDGEKNNSDADAATEDNKEMLNGNNNTHNDNKTLTEDNNSAGGNSEATESNGSDGADTNIDQNDTSSVEHSNESLDAGSPTTDTQGTHDSSHADAGPSGTADSGASHTSDDNTAIS